MWAPESTLILYHCIDGERWTGGCFENEQELFNWEILVRSFTVFA